MHSAVESAAVNTAIPAVYGRNPAGPDLITIRLD